MATWAEDEIGRKWDRCFTDAIFKFGRKWPIITGGGFGLGMAYANCQEDLNSTIRQQKSRECKSDKKKLPEEKKSS
ncbi:hypothetical protein E2986_13849 [Frieseomelitta varia]|uniref:MICOS complex subunit MIC10 n=1 Tax=Frieseomelitta varia TaxID=561572 RepID=A0A833W519_9HYME|nr:MICOS complex subunit MIC10-like isoform X2 [Frieseomelitta varia]KAF3421168.1 hypothetical protein E2986_13849 [Frieseomelitta varia]